MSAGWKTVLGGLFALGCAAWDWYDGKTSGFYVASLWITYERDEGPLRFWVCIWCEVAIGIGTVAAGCWMAFHGH